MKRFAAHVQPLTTHDRTRSALPLSSALEPEYERLPGRQSLAAEAKVVALQRVIGNRATERLLRAAENTTRQSTLAIAGDVVPVGMLQLVRIEGVPSVKSQWKKTGPFVTDVDLNCGWYCLMAALQYSINKLGLTDLDAPEILAPKTTKRAFAPHENAMEYVTKVEEDPKDMTEWDNLLGAHGPLMVARDLAIPLIGHFVLLVGLDTDNEQVEFFDPLSSGKSHFISFKKFQKVVRPGRTSYVNEDALTKKDKLNKIVAASKERQEKTGEKESEENTKAEIEEKNY